MKYGHLPTFDKPLIWAVGSPPPEVTPYQMVLDMLEGYRQSWLANVRPYFPAGSSKWGAKRLRRYRNAEARLNAFVKKVGLS